MSIRKNPPEDCTCDCDNADDAEWSWDEEEEVWVCLTCGATCEDTGDENSEVEGGE